MVKASEASNVKASSRPTVKKKSYVDIPASLNVRELAGLLHINVIDVIKQMMRNGIMANINQVIDFEVAALIASDFDYAPRRKSQPAKKLAGASAEIKLKLQSEEASNLKVRPPVVTIMGHVDHGKTRLLDTIRETNVMATEAGNITQHIGAYQAEVKGQKITFLDTPGHEAFTAMRARGAQVTDITVLVVAADDGIMPQTLEAIDHAKAAGVPIIVAINKIDKANANPDLVKQQLADNGLIIEEWGGDTVCAMVSAKENEGICDLLENILIVAELEELKANSSKPAVGVVIEAEMDKTKGPMATILVQNGTLNVGDTIVAGTAWGRVKAMFNDKGKRIKKVEPASPAEILGLNEVPRVGDTLNAVASESIARTFVEKHKEEQQKHRKAVKLDNIYDQISAGEIKELNIVLKTDVQGSIEPIRSSLERLKMDEVKVKLIHSSSGNVTEGDVMLALASNGLILSFNTGCEAGAKSMADARDVDIRQYSIIYNLVDDVEKALKGMLEPTFVEIIDSRAEVRATFSGKKGSAIAGIYVNEGTINRGSSVRIFRRGEKIIESTVNSLKRFKDDVKEVAAGYECGVSIKDFTEFETGDILEFFHVAQENAVS